MRSDTKRAFKKVRKAVLEEGVEKALADLITKLEHWKLEIRKHHAEIAKRNFAIGMEIHGFLQLYPPRQFRGMDMMGRIAKALNVHHNYLRLVVGVAAWLYGDRGVRNIRSFMKEHELKSWRQITEFYSAETQGSRMETVHVNKRHASVRRSLEGLASVLPPKNRRRIDEIIKQVTSLVRQVTGEPLGDE